MRILRGKKRRMEKVRSHPTHIPFTALSLHPTHLQNLRANSQMLPNPTKISSNNPMDSLWVIQKVSANSEGLTELSFSSPGPAARSCLFTLFGCLKNCFQSCQGAVELDLVSLVCFGCLKSLRLLHVGLVIQINEQSTRRCRFDTK